MQSARIYTQREGHVRAAVLQSREIAGKSKTALDAAVLSAKLGIGRHAILEPLADEAKKSRRLHEAIQSVNEAILSIGDLLTEIEREATRLSIAKRRNGMLTQALQSAKAAKAAKQLMQARVQAAAAAAAALAVIPPAPVPTAAPEQVAVPGVSSPTGADSRAATDNTTESRSLPALSDAERSPTPSGSPVPELASSADLPVAKPEAAATDENAEDAPARAPEPEPEPTVDGAHADQQQETESSTTAEHE
jgi:hypothetical protein